MIPVNTKSPRLLLPMVLALSAATLACGGRGLSLGAPMGIIGLALLVFQIWAIIEIVQSGRDTVGKVVWVLIVLLVPLIGVICWFVFGRR